MPEAFQTRAARIIARCRELARVTDVPGETTRLFLSPATRDAHTLVGWWMRQAGLEVRVDDAGSLRGLQRAVSDAGVGEEGAPTVVLFSHLDTVPNAGAFDGPLGVLLGIAVAEELTGEPLPFHLEVLAFSEEEGVRFGFPFFSSRAAVDDVAEDLLTRTDSRGASVAQAIRTFGLDPDRISTSARLRPNTRAAIEVHIEQGPVLESLDVPLGVVDTVIGQSRLELTFTGQANHAGTTPMPLRRDALVAAAHWIGEVERFASGYKQLVATVGRVEVAPGAVNVVPGEVRLSLDVRHPGDESRHAAVARLLAKAEHIAAARGISVRARVLAEQASVPLSAALAEGLEAAAEVAGYRTHRMYSGAGHDAMILAPHVPTAMLFVRSPGGLSHHPDESVLEADVEAALATVLELVQHLHL
ncbi:MAG TPA: allantoate amidohydrolase [Acidobacteriaceae bacterium]|nr:allantoate amidohydrolase [Acidobacteriaceae bacterium]